MYSVHKTMGACPLHTAKYGKSGGPEPLPSRQAKRDYCTLQAEAGGAAALVLAGEELRVPTTPFRACARHALVPPPT